MIKKGKKKKFLFIFVLFICFCFVLFCFTFFRGGECRFCDCSVFELSISTFKHRNSIIMIVITTTGIINTSTTIFLTIVITIVIITINNKTSSLLPQLSGREMWKEKVELQVLYNRRSTDQRFTEIGSFQ